jgi:hypothetical protein
MSTVYAAARAYRLPPERMGTPPAGWPSRRPSAEWTGHIKCWGGTSLVSGVDRAYLMLRRHITCQLDRRRASSAINARPRGLTSGSARWFTSRVVGHVAAPDLRLSGEWERSRYGLDTCQHRTPAWLWLRPGYSFPWNPGTLLWVAQTPPEGYGTRPRGLVCISRGPTLPVGVRTHRWPLRVDCLLWPRGGPGAAHMVGLGIVCHATKDSRMDTVPSYCSKRYPWFWVPTDIFSDSIKESSLKQTCALIGGTNLPWLWLVVTSTILMRQRPAWNPTLSLNPSYHKIERSQSSI